MATKNPKQVVATFLILVVLLLSGIGVAIWRQRTPGVQGTFLVEPTALGTATPLQIELVSEASNVRSYRVDVLQGDQRVELTSGDFADDLQKARSLDLRVDLSEAGLQEAEALLLVYASDDLWRPKAIDGVPVLRAAVRVDLTPPNLVLLGSTRYPEQGGAGVVAVRAETDAQVVVNFGDESFPAYPSMANEEVHVAYYALRHDADPSQAVVVEARDAAGNLRTRGVPVQIRARRFARGEVNVPENWLHHKLPELLPDAGEDFEAGFLKLNNVMRAEAAVFKRELARRSSSVRLWDGAFVQPRNTRVFSNFAETRDYLLAGKKVDTQVHLGFDLASVKHAVIPAANAGRVIFAGDLNIYGSAVVLDHGQGLMTLYAHLSSLNVAEGDQVPRGHELGRSGTTGLAVGDHLHYEVLVHGIPVTPLQWWDGAWIRDHIAGPLAEAGLEAPGAR